MKQIIAMVAKRLAFGVVTLFVISLIIFLGVEMLPGDLAHAILGQAATPEKQSRLFAPSWAWTCQRTRAISTGLVI